MGKWKVLKKFGKLRFWISASPPLTAARLLCRCCQDSVSATEMRSIQEQSPLLNCHEHYTTQTSFLQEKYFKLFNFIYTK